ncbi:MAG: magnesium-translocating P-type ATPase [Methanotrichaceae archaeon]|nr:magnesium-translocating P-type ATPase [Methanotrichaceae archaeon]
MSRDSLDFWSVPAENLLNQLGSKREGLTDSEANRRLKQYGSNLLRPKKERTTILLFLAQFKSPIILLLVFAASLSVYLGQGVDAVIILIIILISGTLGFWQERGAADAMAKLLAIVQIKVSVLRDGEKQDVPLENVVSGDIVLLSAGDIIPGDSRIIESRDLFVNEATLTGETYPAEKMAAILPENTQLSKRINNLFMGTNVVSGTATALVVHTGTDTEFGQVSQRLKLREPETEFEIGVRHFGYLLLEVTLLLVVSIFAINVYMHRPIIESFLFSLALAVGLTPQLLPAIISINLAHGARRMASHKVIVKRLASIENFGSMNVLCSDKTGTLTEGTVKMQSALDVEGKESQEVYLFAYLNSFYETGFSNPIDRAVLSFGQADISGFEKLDEVPYDFIRKRLSILVSKGDKHIIVTKGAMANVLEVCTTVQTSKGPVGISQLKNDIMHNLQEISEKGFRVLGISYREIEANVCMSRDEADMTFLGFLVFFDPPKAGIVETIDNLASLGLSLKIITGDNRYVAASLAKQLGLSGKKIIIGHDLHKTSDEALLLQVQEADIFAEVEPNQKEKIILALRKNGNVVGFIGDGINDASALHAADVGLSVDSAVDVAKEAADIVLLEKDLSVLSEGVVEGRKTFANTMKYVFMATSANFGNMFSMALLSIFVPFLPLLPTQVLLTNLLTDLPEMTISGDSVDPELVSSPRRWSIKFIRGFMVVFGLLSSLFDYLTFGVLLLLLHASVYQFRTGWFMESVVSASLVVIVIRTRRPFFRSRPSKYLLAVTLIVCIVAFLIPYTPLAEFFGFMPIPSYFILIVIIIVALYILLAEVVKRSFYRIVKY